MTNGRTAGMANGRTAGMTNGKNHWLNTRGMRDIQNLLRQFLQVVIAPGDTVVDGTAGRGRDTLFLAECVGDAGKVYAFDIQDEAIQATRQLLQAHGLEHRVELIAASHEKMPSYVPRKIKAAVFNLGYLPGSASKLTTKPASTVAAVAGALSLLEENGLIAITVYRGHDRAAEESQALLDYLSNLEKKDFSVLQGIYLNQTEESPYWVMIQNNRRRPS